MPDPMLQVRRDGAAGAAARRFASTTLSINVKSREISPVPLIVGREPFDDELEDFQFAFRRGENFGLQDFLRRLDPRDVRVAEH